MGPNASGESDVIASCELYLQDRKGQTSELIFDVTHDISPIFIGMDMKRYTVTNDLLKAPIIIMERAGDTIPR